MNQPLRILVISSVRPGEPSAGPVVLQRHLCESKEIVAFILPECRAGFFWRIAHRLSLKSVASICMVLSKGRRWDRSAIQAYRRTMPDAILTVAHGDAYKSAVRVAVRMGLPLISFYHDWWPDIPRLPYPLRISEARQFRLAYTRSTVALCVSEQMRMSLGEHCQAQVLFPIPSRTSGIRSEKPTYGNTMGQIFRVIYGGNLSEYGPMLGEALLSLAGLPRVRLEVRGSKPKWPVSLQEHMKSTGNWLDFALSSEWQSWLQSADAFLLPMVFDSGMRRRMETSFPSKLPEFAQFGKPIIIWGPEYCSVVQWARQKNRAMCVTNPDPNVLRQALEELTASPDEQQRLAAAARQAAKDDFNPDRIQAQFIEALRDAIAIHKAAKT